MYWMHKSKYNNEICNPLWSNLGGIRIGGITFGASFVCLYAVQYFSSIHCCASHQYSFSWLASFKVLFDERISAVFVKLNWLYSSAFHFCVLLVRFTVSVCDLLISQHFSWWNCFIEMKVAAKTSIGILIRLTMAPSFRFNRGHLIINGMWVVRSCLSSLKMITLFEL